MNDHRYALLHARATSDAKGRHHVALTRHGLPDEVTSAAYTLRVLEAFEPMRAALEGLAAVYGDDACWCNADDGDDDPAHHYEYCKRVNAALRAAREVGQQ